MTIISIILFKISTIFLFPLILSYGYTFDFGPSFLDTFSLSSLANHYSAQSVCYTNPQFIKCNDQQVGSYWYFNMLKNRCELVSDCLMGKNSFRTEEECENKCNFQKETSDIDKCSSPPMAGLNNCLEESAQQIRLVYFNKVTKTCDWYMYFGCGDSLNMFKSIDECRETCLTQEILKEIDEKSLAMCSDKPDDMNYFELDMNSKEKQYRCYMKNKDKSTIRWFYDKTTNVCNSFGYYHCSSSSTNNFLTRNDCNQFCGVKTYSKQEICNLPMNDGFKCGEEEKELWYFDPNVMEKRSKGACRPFRYKGCGGGLNKFASRTECLSKCQEMKICIRPERTVQPFLEDDSIFEARELALPEPCRFPITIRNCTDSIGHNNNDKAVLLTKYFFDPSIGKCEKMKFHGCGPSVNLYDGHDDCTKSCTQRIIPNYDKSCHKSVPNECKDMYLSNVTVFTYQSESDTCKKISLKADCSPKEYFSNGRDCLSRCAKKRPTEVAIQNRCFARTSYFAEKSLNCTTDQMALKWFYSWETDRCVPEEICTNGNDHEDLSCAPVSGSGTSEELSKDGFINSFNSQHECERICKPTNAKEICTQPMEKGPCSFLRQRFYFDMKSSKCREFFYGGCLGNLNRFNTMRECEEFCHSLLSTNNVSDKQARSSIASAPTLDDFSNNTLKEFLMNSERLPAASIRQLESLYQRYGEKETTSPCREHYSVGSCPINNRNLMNRFYLSRYYFHNRSNNCRPFMFNGCGPSTNLFETLDSCNFICTDRLTKNKIASCHLSRVSYHWLIDHTVVCSPEDIANVWFYNSERSVCEVMSTCRENPYQLDGVYKTEEECFFQCKIKYIKENQLSNICHLRNEFKETEDCSIMREQWYYDSDQGSCLPQMNCEFYGNNFRTKEECLSTCSPLKIIDVCRQPMDMGVGEHFKNTSVIRWYYDWVNHVCKPFLYAGKLGNSNRFITIEECNMACEKNDFCKVSPKVNKYAIGSNIAFKDYYYNANMNECQPYIPISRLVKFGNSFETKEECIRKCMKTTEIKTSQGVSIDWEVKDLLDFVNGGAKNEDELNSLDEDATIVVKKESETKKQDSQSYENVENNNVANVQTDTREESPNLPNRLEESQVATKRNACLISPEALEIARQEDMKNCDIDDVEESVYFVFENVDVGCVPVMLKICLSKAYNSQIYLKTAHGNEAVFSSNSDCVKSCIST